MAIQIGTSGWHYKHWIGTFYPEGTKQKDFKDEYIKSFKTVELNNPFYRLPTLETFATWKNSTPADFIFAVKASRFITHMKKLKDPQQSMANFMNNVDALEEKLGPILFQLPPSWNFDEERFKAFLEALPKGYQYAVEFRNETWFNDRAYDLLEKHNVAFCIYELEYYLTPLFVTSNLVYIRLHGPERKYAGSYSDETLQLWADRCLIWQEQGKDVYLYFDNDQLGYAGFNALTLTKMVTRQQVLQESGVK